MSIERLLRQRIRQTIRANFRKALIVGQPANAMTGPGRPDLYVVVSGVFVGLELKTPTGKPTDIQLENIKSIRAAGGYAWIVRSPQAAVGAVWAALRGERMSGDFDFLFEESSPNQDRPRTDAEVRAFLQEPEIQAAVERNGHVPAGDGAAIEPAADYSEWAAKGVLDRIEKKLDRVIELLTVLPDDTQTEFTDLLAGPEEPPPPSAPAPKSRTRKPKA